MRHTNKQMQMQTLAAAANGQSSSSATGKLVLAAIVHHDTNLTTNGAGQTEGESHQLSNVVEQNDLAERYEGASRSRQRHQVAHEAESGEQKGAKRARSKLGRLLSIKTTSRKQTRTLIDSAPRLPTARDDSPPKRSSKLQANEETTTTNLEQAQQEQVLEFKFDLIVELGRAEPMTGGGHHMERLNDSINQLLESFVLDSNDVCLMSVGKRRLATDEFHYLSQLARHSVAHCFELLQPAGSAAPQDSQLVSMELSGLLLQLEGEREIRTVDLLLDDHCDLKADGWQPSSLPCDSVQLAQLGLEQMMRRLAKEQPASELLLLGLKLKRRINGGLFTNRMCLIDYEPELHHLRPIFENIFNGQALAYLKRHRAQVRLVPLGGDPRAAANVQLSDQTESSLRRAEWLLYKHLSSALIKTLLVVHVHRFAAAPTGGVQEPQLSAMAHNLELLEFARSIQRASASRLKRRKRHLRSHLASSNLSVNSNHSANTKQAASSPLHRSTMGRRTANQHRRGSSPSRRPPVEPQEARCCASMQRKASLDLEHQRCQHGRRQAAHRATGGSWSRRRATSSGRHVYELTESSSMSTSSGGGGGGGRPVHLQPTSSYLSDSDSIASANLNSCSSSSAKTRQCLANSALSRQRPSRHRRDIELKWLEKQSRKIQSPEQSSSPAETSIQSNAVGSTNRLRAKQLAANVIQIDCPKGNNDDDDDHTTSSTLCSQFQTASTTMQLDASLLIDKANESLTDNDNVSDIYSVIAPEPPKQLKLEEFLHQLSNIIAPSGDRSAPASSEDCRSSVSNGCKLAPAIVMDCGRPLGDRSAAANCPTGRDNGAPADEDDEDCKSHSSILEHLSTLALESSSKLSGKRPEAPPGGLPANQSSPSPTEWPRPPDELQARSPAPRQTNRLEQQLKLILKNNNQASKLSLSPRAADDSGQSSPAQTPPSPPPPLCPADPSSQAEQLYAMVMRSQDVHT